MNETVTCQTASPLLQGDILRLEFGDNKLPFSLAVIINADCDMENNKTDGVIAYLPIYSFEEYLEQFWIRNYIAEQKKDASLNIKNICLYDDNEIMELIRWINQTNPNELNYICDKISEQFSAKKQKTKINDYIKKLALCVKSDGLQKITCLREFAAAGILDDKEKENKIKKYIKDRIIEAKNSMGEGHLFVSDIKGEIEIGFVVRMRRIYSIDAKQCFRSKSDLISKSATKDPQAVRVAKFSPHYQFKIAQLFAHQYSKIGLPNEVSALSEIAVDSIKDKILAVA